MAKTIITGPGGASTGNASDHTEGPYAPVKTGRKALEGGK